MSNRDDVTTLSRDAGFPSSSSVECGRCDVVCSADAVLVDPSKSVLCCTTSSAGTLWSRGSGSTPRTVNWPLRLVVWPAVTEAAATGELLSSGDETRASSDPFGNVSTGGVSTVPDDDGDLVKTGTVSTDVEHGEKSRFSAHLPPDPDNAFGCPSHRSGLDEEPVTLDSLEHPLTIPVTARPLETARPVCCDFVSCCRSQAVKSVFNKDDDDVGRCSDSKFSLETQLSDGLASTWQWCGCWGQRGDVTAVLCEADLLGGTQPVL